ncbi:MAG: hypothetical protein ACON42_04195 [Flavobacteriaceae bacterium]
MKFNFIIISVGIIKDVFRLFTGMYLFSIDIATTGYFFATISPAIIFLTWSENVDGESLIDDNPETNLKTYYFPISGLIICISYLIFSPIFFQYVFIYFITRIGYFYYRTFLIENDLHLKLMYQKLIEVLLLLILIMFRSKLSIEYLLILFLSIQNIPSLFFLNRLKQYMFALDYSNFKFEKSVFLSARSLSILLKNIVNNVDSILLASFGNPEGAGLVKYIRSMGNGQNLVINQIVDRFRHSFLKKWIQQNNKKHLLSTIIIFLCFGLSFGFIFFKYVVNLIENIFYVPEFPVYTILFFGLYAVSPVMRVSYLYSKQMKFNIITHLIIFINFICFVVFHVDSLFNYIILPQLIALLTFLIWVYKLNYNKVL